jgi:hypothetical protein
MKISCIVCLVCYTPTQPKQIARVFKENQMKSKIIQTLVEWTLAIVIFGGWGVLLAWRG